MVLLRTTAGDIDIELWSKEAPKACRNFIQLCMEDYYNNTIFHRVVPGFIVQGGDPTGTGSGGDSIYGAPFKDEFHSRLRFNRRGLVAMANAGPHDNGSQFFFTLGRADELNNKHTIFGKVSYMGCFSVVCYYVHLKYISVLSKLSSLSLFPMSGKNVSMGCSHNYILCCYSSKLYFHVMLPLNNLTNIIMAHIKQFM
uniref:Peptidyl-prolyl cis-trans isomerase n=1 Tax=Accipiter nisus TaxID=211598 RepID=A0A8B9RYS7_9AVES